MTGTVRTVDDWLEDGNLVITDDSIVQDKTSETVNIHSYTHTTSSDVNSHSLQYPHHRFHV